MMEQKANEFQFRFALTQRGVLDKISKFVKSSDAHETLNELVK